MKLMQIFISHISEDRLVKNYDAFHAIDEDNSGHIQFEEMILAIEDLKLTVPDLDLNKEDIQTIFDRLDRDFSGSINYSNFIIGTLDPVLIEDRALLDCLFKELDVLNEGFLTKESVQIAMKRKGI